MQTIYEPKGRALEYSPYALNLYSGCQHGCFYCYAPGALRMDRETFNNNAEPRKDILPELEKTAHKFTGKEVLLSFTSDPYQPIERELEITREAIKILKQHGVIVNILSKGGMLSTRDFDLLEPGVDKYGATLTFVCLRDSLKFEPEAASPAIRMTALKVAKDRGLKTWVSLEPVIIPGHSLHLIHATKDYVDEYKLGKWNHAKEASKIDWKLYLKNAEAILRGYKKKYYIKDDLKKVADTDNEVH